MLTHQKLSNKLKREKAPIHNSHEFYYYLKINQEKFARIT